jgi:UMF1 family MFS transporter
MPEALAPPTLPVRRREIFGWAMFDFANSSYTTVVVTVAYAVYFTEVVAPGARADWLWGSGLLAANLLGIALAPLVGAMADDAGRKKLFLGATWLLCVAATAALALVGPGAVALGLGLFVASHVAFSLGDNLVAAFLPEIATPGTMGRISGLGWGLGYMGGLLALVAVRPLIAGGFDAGNERLPWAWVVTALFFLLAGLPTFLLLRERAPRGSWRSLPSYARAAFGRLATTARAIGHFSELARFLAVFFVYSCGLTIVVAFAGIFAARTLGYGPDELIVLFLSLQVSSTAGALLFGVLQDRLGSRRTIQLALVLWIVVSIAAAACRTKGQFLVVALVAGLGIGSLQSASRALVGMFSPAGKSGEFFAFWGLAGKGAYALGPAIFGAISSATGSQRLAVVATAGFFAAGLFGMAAVDETRGRAAAAAWERTRPAASAR